MAFGVSLPSLANPAQSVVVNPGLVSALEAVPPALLPIGIPAGTRVSIIRGADAVETSYVDVVGTVAATAAALGATSGGAFGSDFLQSSGSDGQTDSGVFVPVPGTQRTVTWAGSVFLAWSTRLGQTGINDGAEFVVLKNGAPLPANPGPSNVGALVAPIGFAGLNTGQPLVNASGTYTDACVPGDVYELGMRALPGGPPFAAQWFAPVLNTWRAT